MSVLSSMCFLPRYYVRVYSSVMCMLPCLIFISYAPALHHYRDRLNVVHFIGSFKPWQWLRFADGTVFPRNTSSKDSIELVQQWWNVFDKFIGGKVRCLSLSFHHVVCCSEPGKFSNQKKRKHAACDLATKCQASLAVVD